MNNLTLLKANLKFTLLTVFFFYLQLNWAQCTETSAWYSTTASSSSGSTVNIGSNSYAGEYSTIYGITSGSTYTVNSSAGCITVHSGSPSGPVVGYGTGSVTFTASTTGTYYIAYSTNCSGCGNTLTGISSSITTVSTGGGSGSSSGCNTNISICTPGTAGPFTFAPASPDPSSCLDYWNGQSSPNYGYIVLYITQAGYLNLLINANTTSGFLDVAIFDITGQSNPCASLGLGTELGCNYADNSGGCNEFAQNSASNFGCNSTVDAPYVNVGDVIMILVEDWSDNQTSFTLDLSSSAGSAQTGPPDATINPVGPFCTSDGPVQLTAADNGGTWSGTGVNSSGIFTPSTAGVGTHTISYSIGSAPCNDASTTTITVSNGNVAGTASSTVSQLCGSGSVPLTLTGYSGTVQWQQSTSSSGPFSNIGGATSANYTAPGVSSNMCYRAQVSGCGPAVYSNVVCVTVNTPVVTNAGADQTVCAGGSITLNGSISGGTTTGTWSAPSGLFSTPSNLSATYTPSVSSGTVTLTLTSTDPAGVCPSTTDQMVVTVNPAPNANFSIAGNQCLSTNSLTVTNTGTTGTYTWSFPSGTPSSATGASASVSYASAGTYNITLTTTVAGCTDQETISVTIYPTPTIAVSPTPVSCNGSCNGSITATGSGSSGYNYNWGAAGTGATLTNQCAGSYNVTMTDINGCTATGSGTITQPLVLAVTASSNNVSCAGLNDGQVSAGNATGGTAPYTYSWNGGLGTGQTINNVPGGNYMVTVTDANGCTANASTTVNSPTAIVVTATSSDANCGASDGTLSVSGTTGGSGSYVSTAWTDASNNSVGNPSAVPAGSYTVTVTDNNSCTGTATVSVGNLAGPVLSVAGQTNASCSMINDGTATVSVTGGSGSPSYSWAPTPGSGQGTASASGLTGGTAYTVTVTDAGCSDVLVINIGTNPDPTASATVDQNALCSGNCNGQSTASMTGGTGPFTYDWSNNESTQQAIALCIGSTSVLITDANGCTANASVNITSPNPLSVNIVGTDATCNGGTNGSADATITNGTAPYTMSWTHGPTSVDLNNVLAAGNYTLQVTDANGCVASGNVTISEPSPINISSISATPVACSGSCDGIATANASGGTGTLSYEWFNSSNVSSGTNNPQSGLCAGSYTLEVTDANGCISTNNTTINSPTPITLTPTTTNSHCGQADGGVSVIASGGSVTSTYTYAWEDASNNPVGTSSSISGQLAGTYTVTVSDDNGCSATTTATISDLGGSTLSETHVNTNCNAAFDGSINLTVTGGSAPFNYSWTGPNGYTATTQDINLLEAGTYDVTVTDAVNCISTLSIIINQPTAITLTPNSTDATCFGSSTGALSATATGGTGAYSFVWYDDALLSSSIGAGATVNNVGAGTYYVEVTDANGCSSDGSISVSEPNQIIVTTTATDANCGLSDGAVSVTNTSGGSGNYVSEVWVDASSSPVADINAIPSGSYTVTVTDNNGCTGTTVQGVSDLVGPSLSILSVNSVSCVGYCDALSSVEATGGTPGYSYLWSPAPGSGQGTASVSGLCGGNYNVTVTDANGCTDNVVVTVAEPTPLVGSMTSNTDVTINGGSDGTANVSASGGTPAYSYEWYSSCPPGTSIGQTNSNSTGLSAGPYSVVITDSKGCMDTVCTTINEPSTISIVETISDALCFGACDGEISITVSGGVPGYTYEWFDASNNTSINQTTLSASGLCAGSYYVIVEDQNGATQTSSNFVVGEPSAISLTTSVTSDYNGFDISCFGDCDGAANISASGGVSPYSYSWDTNAGNQTTAAASNLCDGTFNVVVTDANGCPETASVTLSEPTEITNTPSQVDVSCNGLCDGTADAVPSGGAGGYTYQWNDPSLSTTSGVSGLCAGSFNVVINDMNGCGIANVYVINEPIALVLNQASNGSNCGQNDGDATVSVASGVSPYSYQWDSNAGNQTTSTAANLIAGCYDVTVTDGNGCTENLNICVQDLGAPTVSLLTQTDVSCNGGNDGFAQIQITNGTPPYSYTWEDCIGNSINQTTASAFNLPAGCYNGSMVDNVGCTGSVSVTITEPTALNAAITSSNDVSCYGFCDGTATVTAGGGTAPYTYLWNDVNGQSTATASNLCPGTYQVDVTDAQGCTFSTVVTIAEPDEIILSSADVDAFCSTSTGSATVSISSGGVSPFSYNWNPTSQTTSTATNLIPGTYDATVTDADGCIQSIQVTVGNIPASTAAIGNITNVSCNGGNDGSIDVSVSGTGTSPYTYQWFNGTSNTSITGQTSALASNLPQGDYYVEITDANGCISVSNVGTIAEPTALSVSLSSGRTVCFGECNGQSTATVNGGTTPYSYQWDDPLSQTTNVASNLCSTNYNLVVTDANGCQTNGSIAITEPSMITIDSTVVNANCGQPDGEACVIPTGGTGPYTYLWPDASTNSCATNLIAGTYIVSVFDQNLCEQQIGVEIQDLGGPAAAIISSTNVSCNSFSDGQATVDMVSGNGTTYTVQWDANTGSQTTPTASNLEAGIYSVTITDNLGCNASTSVTIVEPAAFLSNANVDDASCFSYCDGEAEMIVTGGTTPYSFEWYDDNNSPLGSGSSINGLCMGTYGITVVDANGCSFNDNIVVGQPVEVTGTITGTDITCFGACDGVANASGISGVGSFSYTWDTGTGNQVGSTAQNLCPGTYSVTITDSDGCFAIESITLTEPTDLVSSIAQSGNISCNGFCDGFIQGDVTGGTLPYSYQWSNNPGTNALATNLCAGNYTFTVTDGNGCVSTSSMTLTQPQPLSASTSQTNLSCFQSCDGMASVAVAGGVSPYNYLWNNSSFGNTASISNECAGTYSVEVTDANGCELSKTIVITQPTALSISANVTNSNCGQANGQICANVNGGTAPYTYQWNDPNTQTGACGLNLGSGCYTFTIVDANACIQDTLLCVNDLAGPSATGSNSVDVTCFGANNGSVTFTASGGSGTLSHQIKDGAGNVIVTGALQATGLGGGCYTFITTDGAGCTASDLICIDEPSQLNSTITQSTNALCNLACDGTAVAGASGGVAPYVYSWNSGSTPNQNSNSGLCAGSYTVTITDANNCTTQSSVTINQPAPIVINETISNVTCYGGNNGSINANVSGGTPFYVYSWTNAAGSTPTVSGLSAGNYSLNLVDANGCGASANYTISEPTQLVPSFVSFNSPTCEQCNGTALVSGSGGTGTYSYLWSGGINTTSASNSGMCPGIQQITITDANGCSASLSQQMINQASPQIDSITFTAPTCNGLTNGSATVFASGIFPASQFTYTWGASANNQQVQTAVALGDGVYCVTVTDPNGCVASNCVSVLEPTPLNAVPDGSTTICYGQDAQIWASGQGGTSPYTIAWTTPGFSGQGPILVNPTTTTNYCFRVEDDNGCLSPQACVQITVREPLSLNVTPSTFICDGGDIDLTALASGGVPSGYQFIWTDASSNVIPNTTVNDQSSINVGPGTASWYYVTLSDGCSLDAIDSTEITISPNPIAFLAATDSSGCQPFTTQFIASSDIGMTYEYDISCDGSYEYSGANNTFTYTFETDGLYDICLNVISADGCATLITNSDFIEVFPLPIADFTADPMVTTILTPEINFTDNSYGASLYDWDFNDGYFMSGTPTTVYENEDNTNGPIIAPVHSFSDTGHYDVTLTVTNSYGCTNEHTETIYIQGDFTLYTPNAFSPDGDGNNDFFSPTGIAIDRDNYEFYVFNRWGQLIFESYDPNIQWDGRYNNIMSQTDVYVWMVKTKDHKGETIEYQGHVTLVK